MSGSEDIISQSSADSSLSRRVIHIMPFSTNPKSTVLEHPTIGAFLELINLTECDVQILSTTHLDQVRALPAPNNRCIVNLKKLNDIRNLNDFLRMVHRKLSYEGYFVSVVEMMAARYENFWDRYPGWLAHPLYWMDYLAKRVIPGLLPLENHIVQRLGYRGGRVMSKTEVLGRLVYCGFDVERSEKKDGLTYILAKKISEPNTDQPPASGPLLRLNRIGQNGKPVGVYKLRTMHPYAQYLQDYVYKNHGLREGGKLEQDFRITPWGGVLRKLWVDEIPMIINVFKGDLKPVGVRPLSSHYLSLYSQDLRDRRKTVKPGLFPPFYADMPKSIEEIMISEAKYLDAYEQAPIKTDVTYFLRGLYNIIVKQARSK